MLGAGGLTFECLEPFATWTVSYSGPAVQTTSANLIDGSKDGPMVDISFDVEAKMAVPPWVQGALLTDAGDQLKTSIEGDFMGGDRYEQLFRAVGRVTVDGGKEHRLHRQRSANSPPGRPQTRRVLGALLAVSSVSQRTRVRLHRLPAAPRWRAQLQRGLPLQRRRRPRPRARRAGTVADPATTGRRGRVDACSRPTITSSSSTA